MQINPRARYTAYRDFTGPRRRNPKAARDKAKFLEIKSSLQPTYRAVIDAAFEPEGSWSSFLQAPASCIGHHSDEGGLIAHTVEVALICQVLAIFFRGLIDEQVLITSALLHDVGKVHEYERHAGRNWMTDSGRWIGHKTVTAIITDRALQRLYREAPRLATAVLNCVAGVDQPNAHLRGHASFEAVLLSRADHISAAADLFRRSLANSNTGFYGRRHPHMREDPIHPARDVEPRKS